MQITPTGFYLKPTYETWLNFDANSIRTIDRLKPLAISAQSPLTPNYENQSEYLKFNPVEKLFIENLLIK
jgi:hypothetical protein